MTYEDIYEEILIFNDEELNKESLDHLNNIVSLLKNRFLADFKKGNKTFGAYSFYIQSLIEMLAKKIVEKWPNINEENAKSMANKIINEGLIIEDIILVDDMTFIEGRSPLHYASGSLIETGMSNMKNLLSNSFVYHNYRGKSVGTLKGYEVFLQLLESVNTAIKYLLLKDVTTFEIDDKNQIIYNANAINVYTLADLDTLSDDNNEYQFNIAVRDEKDFYSLRVEIINGIVKIYRNDNDIERLNKGKEKIK